MNEHYLKYLLIMPAFFLVGVTILYPMGYALTVSFMDWRLDQSPRPSEFVGLENYVRALFQDPSYRNSVMVTVKFVAGSAVGSVLVALLLALLLVRPGRIYVGVRSLLVLPFAMSPALQATSFRFFLNPEFGLFDRSIKAVFPYTEGINFLGSPGWAMVWLIIVDIWHWAPFLSLILMGGLLAIPRETHEAARVDGANPWQTLWTITLPQLLPVIVIVTILKIIFSFKMFDYAFMMTGGGPGESTVTMSFLAYRMGFHAYDMGYASAIAFTLAILLFAISRLYYRLLFPKRIAGEAK